MNLVKSMQKHFCRQQHLKVIQDQALSHH